MEDEQDFEYPEVQPKDYSPERQEYHRRKFAEDLSSAINTASESGLSQQEIIENLKAVVQSMKG
jgi:hypothetical protein